MSRTPMSSCSHQLSLMFALVAAMLCMCASTTCTVCLEIDPEECRIDPALEGRAVTYAEMCEGHARADLEGYWEGLVPAQGMTCSNNHFVCGCCLQRYAADFATRDLRLRRETGGRLGCPEPGCAELYPYRGLAQNVDDNGFDRLLQSNGQVREVEIWENFDKEVDRRLTLLVSLQSDVPKIIRYIREECLTLKCPRCHTAYFDFTGCMALTCSSCGAGLCGWCGEDCGEDAHRHVRTCPHKPRRANLYFATPAQINEAQKKQKKRHVDEYLFSKSDDVQEKVLKDMKDELDELEPVSEVEEDHFAVFVPPPENHVPAARINHLFDDLELFPDVVGLPGDHMLNPPFDDEEFPDVVGFPGDHLGLGMHAFGFAMLLQMRWDAHGAL